LELEGLGDGPLLNPLFKKVEQKFSTLFKKVEQKFSTLFKKVEQKFSTLFKKVMQSDEQKHLHFCKKSGLEFV
jgi:hypothetical protein